MIERHPATSERYFETIDSLILKLQRCRLDLNHLTLPEIKDFNA